MLKLPKGLKKKKKGKKSKRKGEDELFTEEELENYRKEHQQQAGEGSVKQNEEWSKFKDLTSGVDTVLKKTQGDLDRIKSTSFFQRVPSGVKDIKHIKDKKQELQRPVVEVTEADFPHLAKTAPADAEDKSEYGLTDDESEDELHDDIFDTSYVEAVERGEVKLGYVPDSPEDFQDDDIFDTSHVDALIKGQDSKSSKGKKSLDIGIAVGVLTGRIDNLTVTTKKTKRVIPGDLLLENFEAETTNSVVTNNRIEQIETSILDIDSDIPINEPIDLSVSLHTSVIQQTTDNTEGFDKKEKYDEILYSTEQDEDDEFTLLATESLEVSAEVTKLNKEEITVEPVLQESWSAFEADKNEPVLTECNVEDQIDADNLFIDCDDPFDTSFAEAVVPSTHLSNLNKGTDILEDDEDFDPRAEEYRIKFNNRRKSSVRIHLINPSGLRESITSDELIDKEETNLPPDLLAGSTTDLTQLGDLPLNPEDINRTEIDPFDTTIVDQIVAPGKVELKLLEEELIGVHSTSFTGLYRIPSDPDFDPRADEPIKEERRTSRPENLVVSKSVVFNVDYTENFDLDAKVKSAKPLTPYYTREISITEDINEDTECIDILPNTITRTKSDENLAPKVFYSTKRRYSELPSSIQNNHKFKTSDLLENNQNSIKAKVLTPTGPLPVQNTNIEEIETDPFDTSFACDIAPSKVELKLLTKEFSCEESNNDTEKDTDLLEASDNIFQIKALTPEPSDTPRFSTDNFDPFDTSFATNLNPGRAELKLLESEFLN